MHQLLEDKRGASIIIYMVLLPVFILIIFGALEVWRIISVKQSLHVGTYRTIRCLSMYDTRGTTREGCETLLRTTLTSNGLIDEATANTVQITYYDVDGRVIGDPTLATDVSECGELFKMETELSLPWSSVIPYLPEREMTLIERKSGYIECTVGGWGPPSEGTPITPLN